MYQSPRITQPDSSLMKEQVVGEQKLVVFDGNMRTELEKRTLLEKMEDVATIELMLMDEDADEDIAEILS